VEEGRRCRLPAGGGGRRCKAPGGREGAESNINGGGILWGTGRRRGRRKGRRDKV
jgi:hypothetical protein